eukprot:SAG11_NODE_925_length_6524_cov_3.379300_7_plen_46_part_00
MSVFNTVGTGTRGTVGTPGTGTVRVPAGHLRPQLNIDDKYLIDPT